MRGYGTLAKNVGKAESVIDERQRYVDLAAAFLVLTPENTPGRVLLNASGDRWVIGGRWDRHYGRWVRGPRPADLVIVDWTIQEQQIPIVCGVDPEVLFVGIFAGRQAGKTHIGLTQIAIDAARFPGCESFVLSQDFKASNEIEESFSALLPGEWGVRRLLSAREFHFPHGHVVKFRSAENADSCRGPSTKSVLMDEAALMQHKAFVALVGGGAASQAFRLYITTTPKRECEWVTRIYREWDQNGDTPSPRRRVFHLVTDENPRRNAALLEEIARDTPADIFEQEFRGKLVPPENAAYGRLFDRGTHIRRQGTLPDSARFRLRRQPGLPDCWDYTRKWCQARGHEPADYVGGWDFVREACVWGKIYRDARNVTDHRGRVATVYRDRLWICGAAVNPHTTTDQHAEAVKDAIGTSVGWFTDAMGAYDRSSGRGDVDDAAAITILREHGFAFVEPVAKRNPPVEFRHRTVCRALRSCFRSEEWPDGEARLFIEPKCAPEVIDALENQAMKDGKPAKDGKHEHVMDALGYLVFAVMPIEESQPEGWESPYARKGADE